MSEQQPVWSVSEVNRTVRDLVEGSLMPFWVAGEIGSLVLHRSGHAYFTLKDSRSQLRGCFFGGAELCRRMEIRNGSLIEAFGQLTVYEVRGEYQFSIRKMRPAGIGELQRRFEELKRKLEAEGLFAPERKRQIPLLPRRIGVVTSPAGAAIRDFLQIVNRRFPDITIRIYPCQVQGAGAAEEVASGVEFFNRTRGADVLVVTRGGGSMEDLWPFNEERLARAVAASRIPVISAVGHEIDFTICDFVADLRVPTPSAAAELVIGRQEEFRTRLDRAGKALTGFLQLALARAKGRLERAAGSPFFHEPRRVLELHQKHLDELDMRLTGAVREPLPELRRRLDQLELRKRQAVRLARTAFDARLERLSASLAALDPRRQLERGYLMAVDPETKLPLVTRQSAAGRRIELCFADGTLGAQTDPP